MKRVGGLYPAICDPDNLRLAWLKTRRGKGQSPAVVAFARHLEANLYTLGQALRCGDWQPGRFRSFQISDPKPRTISAAPLPDRVVHHAIMNVLDPIIDARLVGATYACRVGKGTHAAVLRGFAYCQRFGYFLKLDVRKYFDSVNHQTAKTLLARLFKDRPLIDLLNRIIDSYHCTPGCGIPIGNLTSQYIANLYLSEFDHLIVETHQPGAYIRYMDDMVFWSDDRLKLQQTYPWAESWLAQQRQLQLKPCSLGPVGSGLPFLGFRITRSGIYLAQKAKRRYRLKFRSLVHNLNRAVIDEAEFARRALSLAAMTRLARARRFRNTVHHGAVLRHEPRDTRRELEQHRD